MAISIEHVRGQLEELTPESPFRYSPREVVLNGLGELWLDADSTLSTIEGVDELANESGIGVSAAVKRMTELAMGQGGMEHVFARRLELINPTYDSMSPIGQQYVANVVEDAREMIGVLQMVGLRVKIISGGYEQALYQLRDHLGLPENALIANRLLFDDDGKYAGFDDTIPLWTDYGKPIVVLSHHARGDNAGTWGMAGDGKTDAAAGKHANIFIGYGGVVSRPEVEAMSDVYVKCRSLAPIAVIAAGMKRWPYIMKTEYGPLLAKGMEAILNGDVSLRGDYQVYPEEIINFLTEKPWEQRTFNEI